MMLTKKCMMAGAVAGVVVGAVAVLGWSGSAMAQGSRQDTVMTVTATGSASVQQGEAIVKMADMIKRLGATDAMERIRRDILDIQTDQTRIAGDTETFTRGSAGQKPEELSPDKGKKLKELANDQGALADRMNRLLADIAKAKEELKNSDPAAAETLGKTGEVGKNNDIAGLQQSASTGLGKNQMGSVSGQQGRAIMGLSKMLAEIDNNDRRQLEKLERQLAELIEQLRVIQRGEQGVLLDSLALMDEAVKMGDRQQALQMNTIVVQKKAEDTADAQKAAADIRDAGAQMQFAAAPLYRGWDAAAIGPETSAYGFLDSAIRKLEKQQTDVSNKLAEKDLAAFVKEYEEIRAAQTGVKSNSDEIEGRRAAAADKQIDRKGTLELARLAGVQKEIGGHIAALSSDDRLKNYDVIVWMNGQIEAAMQASQEGLAKQQTGAQLANVQGSAIDRLTSLIDALKEQQQQKDPFAPDDPGGSGSPGSSAPPGKKALVPPLAQLKLIRAMQGVVNVETTGVDKALRTAVNDAEKDGLRERAAKLGQTQGELKQILEKLVRDAQ